MGRKRKVCVNQIEEAEKIFREGFENNRFPTSYELRLASRYMKQFHGWGARKVQTELKKLCEKWYPESYFPYPKYLKVVHNAAIDKKKLFISNDVVRLTHTEIEIISHIQDNKTRKFAFGLLCLAKRDALHDLWFDHVFLVKDVMHMVLTRDEILDQLHLMHGYQEGFGGNLIELISRQNKGTREMFQMLHLYYREPNEADQDVAIVVNLNEDCNAVKAYKKIFGENDLRQCGCGDYYTKSPNATKTNCCPNCTKEKRKEKTRERVRKYREISLDIV